MRTLNPSIRSIAARGREVGPRRAAPAIGCAALEMAAVGVLLPGTAIHGIPATLVATLLHLAAGLLMATWPLPQTSRRWLCAVAVFAVPCVGVGVAVVVLCTRGRGSAATEADPRRLAPAALTAATARRLGERLPPCEALLHGDDEQRRATLWTLARRTRPDDMALLRWAASGRDPDLALLAALALDEISERHERLAPGRARFTGIPHAAH